jgi:hypothetical protein
MAISRRLPQSDETRDKALKLAKVKNAVNGVLSM